MLGDAGREHLLQAGGISDSHGQIGVLQTVGGQEAMYWLVEGDLDALVAVGGEREAAVGDAEVGWAGGLEERVGTGDGDLANVAQRRLDLPAAVATFRRTRAG